MKPEFSNVLEFRNTSWWNADVYKELTSHKVSFCGMSHPNFPDDVIDNTSILYYRFHGVPELYRSPYSIEKLQSIADQIIKSRKTKVAYLYFNNDIDVSAIRNAKEMREILPFNEKNKKAT